MFDLHTHTVFSDGELIPSELARRMAFAGNEGFAITDHADFSNIKLLMENLRNLQEWRDDFDTKILFGVEITHVPPKLMDKAVELAWKEGAEIVVVHGETLVEPVEKGTNKAALSCEINVLAHPGIIDEKIADMAKSSGIFLEISTRKGHSLGNGCVAKFSNPSILVVNTDTHSPEDIVNDEFAKKVCMGAGINNPDRVLDNNRKLFRKLMAKVRK